MALPFKKVKRKILNGPDEGQEKYYAVAKANGVSSLEKMCDLISARSTVSSADVKGVLDSLNWAMDLELKSGQIVQLGELGNFRLSLSSEGTESQKELTADKIKGARIIFTPGSALQTTRRNVTFTPVQATEKAEEGGEEGGEGF